ncbi:hypothetical protein RD110_06455 [Rhodoferax koreense]|uniref:TRAP transporter small permease protein n=1 Tax=Rhodoferax koreensis TaxID=1842727 RepID=A0A1P8JT15_9BURK|nr:TRAP transporter small permease subunit [Rhodoferax koreense]APW36878.1 hypothetical protein RD110_06455 [Rhodoferax koreense]
MPQAETSRFRRGLARLDRLLARTTAAASCLVIPLALLLCLQWPLRDGLHAFSSQANDLAQLLFGLYVAVGLTHATRAGTHLTPDLLARRYPARLRRWCQRAAAICVALPWAVFVFVAALPMVRQSLAQLEGFPDTSNPGYFVLKLGVPLMALLAGLQAVLGLWMPAVPEQR